MSYRAYRYGRIEGSDEGRYAGVVGFTLGLKMPKNILVSKTSIFLQDDDEDEPEAYFRPADHNGASFACMWSADCGRMAR